MPTVIVRRVDVWSAAVVYACFGLVAGVVAGLVVATRAPLFLVLTAVGGVIFGALTGFVQALVYNVVARRVGGLRLDFRETAPRPADDLSNEALMRCPHCRALEARDRDTCRFCGESLATDRESP